jgi:hypothetical protein
LPNPFRAGSAAGGGAAAASGGGFAPAAPTNDNPFSRPRETDVDHV